LVETVLHDRTGRLAGRGGRTARAEDRSARQRRLPGPAELVQLAYIARRYYVDDKSKVEIAAELGLSRHKVARNLLKAREAGVVRISIDFPGDLDAALSDQLADAYRLREVIVVDTPDRDTAVVEPLGRAGARLVVKTVQNGETLGIAVGPILGSLAAQLSNLAGCSVVQLTGALSSASAGENPVELIRRVTSINRGSAFPIHAQLFATDPNAAAELRRQPGVRTALKQHSKVTTAVVTIGSWAPPYSTALAELPIKDRNHLIRQGVIAEICTTMIGTDGQIVATSLTDRFISISVEQLASIPNVIAVAGGPSKRLAVKAALTSGLINSLVTDVSTARYLLGIAVGTHR
jgi:DNA-binding transcriptional regulator LsrR (DeoR family)